MDFAAFIKELGRGRHAARSLSHDETLALARAILAGEVPDLQLGALLIALRVKGESLDELSAFLEAAQEAATTLPLPPGQIAPVVIPAYNGARKLPNLTPLLALLLARRGAPVLVHGVREDPGRIATAQVCAALDIGAVEAAEDISPRLAQQRIAFAPIDILAPAIARTLGYRRVLGVRNSMHSVVKLLQPFAGPALRIVSVTHPDYLQLMRDLFTEQRSDALLLRGAEGEAVASVRRVPEIDWWSEGKRIEHGLPPPAVAADAALPEPDASGTAAWIARVLAGELPVPAAIAFQAELAWRAANALGMRNAAEAASAKV
jgi:anthranilate phosphoribosyltransferase